MPCWRFQSALAGGGTEVSRRPKPVSKVIGVPSAPGADHRDPVRDLGDAGGDVELQHRGRGQRRAGIVVDQLGVTTCGPALGRRDQAGFARDAILQVAEIVGQGAQRLQEHHPEIGFGPFLPGRVAQGREVEQRLAEAEEILGQIVDRRRIAGGSGAIRRRGQAVEVGWAAGLQGERDGAEEDVQHRTRDGQQIVGEVAGCGDAKGQNRMAVVPPPVCRR